MSGRRHRLWLALRFRDLPLSALDATPAPDEPTVVAERQQVVFCNQAAGAAGVVRGMDLTTARLLSGCRTLSRDLAREERALCRLREQLYRFTPHIDIHRSRESGLVLEISTCLRLFGGAGPLCEGVLSLLASANHELRHGLAHTAAGAWLLSFARYPVTGDETRALFIERLNHLPVQVLYDHPQAVETLVQTGFTTLGDVARQIRGASLGSLTRRLGKGFAATIADIYGIDRDFSAAALFPQPVTTYIPEETFRESLQFDDPVHVIDHLLPAVESLLQRLSDFLRLRQLECQHLRWRFSDIQHRRETVDIKTDASQSGWELFYDLTRIRFDNRPLPFEVDCLELICLDSLPRGDHRRDLDLTGERRPRSTDRELAVTLAKLKARVGNDAVYKVGYRDSLLPEWSHAIIGLAEKTVQRLPDAHRHAPRPAWLFTPARPIEYRHQRLYWQGYLTLTAGPERLAGHWWEESVARDYYLARRQDNLTLWIYRDLHRKQWYVQGVFS